MSSDVQPVVASAASKGSSTWLLIVICGVCDATYGSLAPFLPQHALELGLSQTATGVIFSSFMWGGLIWTPISTRISRASSPRLLLSGCVILQSVLTATFALTANIARPSAFFAAALVIRLLQGLVTNTYEVAVSALILRSCAPDRVGAVLGMQESARGVGLMLGPAFGGALFATGGFALPFVVSAAALLLLAVLLLVAMPNPAATAPRAGLLELPPVGMVDLFALPGIGVTTMLFCSLAVALSLLDPILGPHEKANFHLLPAAIGLIFSAPTLAYASLAPLAGAVGARCGNFALLAGGMVVTSFSYLLLGPCPWLPAGWLPESLGLLIGAMVMLGVGASTLICAVPVLLSCAHAAGLSTEAVSDMVGGIMALAWTGGALIGPLFGSAVVDALGFESATSVTGVLLLAITLIGAAVFSATFASGHQHAVAEALAAGDYAAFPEPPALSGRAASAFAIPSLSEPLVDPVSSSGDSAVVRVDMLPATRVDLE